MSLIKYKSEENLEAAKLLNDNKKFTSSVHCSYYAVLQIMKYALNEKCHISYEKQNEPKDKDSLYTFSLAERYICASFA